MDFLPGVSTDKSSVEQRLCSEWCSLCTWCSMTQLMSVIILCAVCMDIAVWDKSWYLLIGLASVRCAASSKCRDSWPAQTRFTGYVIFSAGRLELISRFCTLLIVAVSPDSFTYCNWTTQTPSLRLVYRTLVWVLSGFMEELADLPWIGNTFGLSGTNRDTTLHLGGSVFHIFTTQPISRSVTSQNRQFMHARESRWRPSDWFAGNVTLLLTVKWRIPQRVPVSTVHSPQPPEKAVPMCS